jgi:hypothetical protein
MIRPDFQDTHVLSFQNERAAQRLAEGRTVALSDPRLMSRLVVFSGSLLIGLGSRLQRWAGGPAEAVAETGREVVWR